MHSWQADVLQASDHVFGSFLSPPLPLIQPGESCKTNRTAQNLQGLLLKLEWERVWLLQTWPLLLCFQPVGRCVVMKVFFSHFLLYRRGLGRSSDALQKQQKVRSFQITFPSPQGFLLPPPPLKQADNFGHFCGFSETPNQTFKQMIS